MEYVIVTGMSGAGKSTALKIMEDIGYFCVDNFPIPLLEKFVVLRIPVKLSIRRLRSVWISAVVNP